MPIITVSRGSMSGGQALAECLAVALGSPCIGREIVLGAAAKLGVSEQVLAEKLEKSPGLWERLTMERRLYVAAVQAALAEYAAEGDLVYHGFAGHLLLRGVPALLRVRLIAPMEMRIRAIIERESVSPDDAERVIRERDANRHRWTEAMYGVDLSDPRLYDLVINLETMTIPSACAVVMTAAQRPEYAVTAEVRARLHDFLLASRVKVALATQPGSRGLDLEVAAARGVVTIRGKVPRVEMLVHASSRWEQEITQIARSVRGVEDVALDLHTFDPYH
jgi:cytidylate kinase